MTKRALAAVAAFLGLCHSLSAQQTQSLGQFPFGRDAMNFPFLQNPPLTFADGERFSCLTSFSWQTPVNFLPPFNPVEPPSATLPARSDREDSFKNPAMVRVPDRIYVGGEVGILFGKSTGKYGGDFEQAYIIGEMGNEWFHLTVGTSYERSTWRSPRGGR